ncbi:MAG: nitroreductase family protein [Deltaproteobacteria bacterium]|nr:nitroreductase family protein [Deltaproteobacteria bacterium]
MLISVLQKRRSIRRFLEKDIEPEKIDALIEAALRSPSSMGRNPWEFIIVTDKAILHTLSRAKEHGSAFMKNAPLGIVICADPDTSDVWIEDASIASIILHLTAASLGLGSCWIQIRERMHNNTKTAEAFVADVLHLPENVRVLSMVGIGYPAEEKPGHGKETLNYGKVHWNRYGEKKKGGLPWRT